MATYGCGTVLGESEKAYHIGLVPVNPGWHEMRIWLSKKDTALEPLEDSELYIVRISGRLSGILKNRGFHGEHHTVKDRETLESLL